MTPVLWLMTASIIVWGALAAFIAFIAFAQKSVAMQCKRLERIVNEHQD